MSGGKAYRWVKVFSICLVLMIASPFAALGGYAVYTQIFPEHGAENFFPEDNVALRYALYVTWDEAKDSGEYLTVIRNGETKTERLSGYDWAHDARLNVYRTAEGLLAVAGSEMAMDNGGSSDYLVKTEPLLLVKADLSTMDDWTYVGAFDFDRSAGLYHRRLKFYEAPEMAECIAMHRERDPSWDAMPRAGKRQRGC